MLSREKMIETIQKGGSVLLPNGKLATKVEQLPSSAALANTPEEIAAAANDTDAQIAKLLAEKAELEAKLAESAQADSAKTETKPVETKKAAKAETDSAKTETKPVETK